MLIEVNLSAEQHRRIEEHIQEPLEPLLKRVVLTRIRQLDKAATPRRPIGRPKHSELDAQISTLREVYETLKGIYPAEKYLAKWGAQETELNQAILDNNLATLQRFQVMKPWLA